MRKSGQWCERRRMEVVSDGDRMKKWDRGKKDGGKARMEEGGKRKGMGRGQMER